MLDNFDWWFIPIANPDGYSYSWTKVIHSVSIALLTALSGELLTPPDGHADNWQSYYLERVGSLGRTPFELKDAVLIYRTVCGVRVDPAVHRRASEWIWTEISTLVSTRRWETAARAATEDLSPFQKSKREQLLIFWAAIRIELKPRSSCTPSLSCGFRLTESTRICRKTTKRWWVWAKLVQ